jgi:hypothetical protein
MMQAITAETAKKMVEDAKDDTCGKTFTVTFIKRTTGKERVMNCRYGVKKHLKGGVKAYDPKKKGLVCVFDMQAGGYRSIALESIRKIAMEGEVYEVRG